MTDAAATPDRTTSTADAVNASLARRNRKQFWLKAIGLAAMGFAFLMLFILVASIVRTGFPAFTQTQAVLEVRVDPEEIDADRLAASDFDDMMEAAIEARFPGVEDRDEKRELSRILSRGAESALQRRVVEDPGLIGRTITVSAPVSDPYDQLNKGLIDRDTPNENRLLSDRQIAWFDELKAAGETRQPLNWSLFTQADSRFPELAGLKGAIYGSFWALLTCFLISFPLGVGAAIYLEEFARKDRFADIIEVNINNLAAVPSIVFGLLALAVFLGWFGLPRSVPFVGGMTLALMTLPTIIIATRASLKAVPPSIREAALGVGASQQQVVFGHVLPLAMPGILTGTIIGLAQALGETAPLLLIGMNAFITSAPSGAFDPATALPTQIYIWADSPERGFVSRTSAAILVLLGFLVLMNGLAVVLRQFFERRW